MAEHTWVANRFTVLWCVTSFIKQDIHGLVIGAPAIWDLSARYRAQALLSSEEPLTILVVHRWFDNTPAEETENTQLIPYSVDKGLFYSDHKSAAQICVDSRSSGVQIAV